jgi:hypothetical protein
MKEQRWSHGYVRGNHIIERDRCHRSKIGQVPKCSTIVVKDHSNDFRFDVSIGRSIWHHRRSATEATTEGTKVHESSQRQSGNLVKQSGWWRVRFRLDQPATEKRKQMSLKIAPVGMGLSRSELERRAKEIIHNAGANSEERFNQVVLGEATFRKQAKTYLQKAVSRNRRPLRDTVSIEGAMRKWIFPAIGDLPLSLVDTFTKADRDLTNYG